MWHIAVLVAEIHHSRNIQSRVAEGKDEACGMKSRGSRVPVSRRLSQPRDWDMLESSSLRSRALSTRGTCLSLRVQGFTGSQMMGTPKS